MKANEKAAGRHARKEAPLLTMLDPRQLSASRAVLIAGSTASGKSRLAIKIAAACGGIVINADAMQVYRRWRILTARPSPEDEASAEHALFGHVDSWNQYSVGHWLAEVSAILSDPRGRLPIITGGTGLYFHALTEGLADIPEPDPEVRAAGRRLLHEHGPDVIAEQLRLQDPETFQRIDRRNPARLLRAWEVLTTSGKGLSKWQEDTPRPLLPLKETCPLLMNPARETVAARIERRLSRMLRSGLLEECADALSGWNPRIPSAKAIGAEEFIAYLQGRIPLNEATRQTAAATRRFAKRQRTWFRSRLIGWHSISEI